MRHRHEQAPRHSSPLPSFTPPPGVSHLGGESTSTTGGGKAGTYQRSMVMSCADHPGQHFQRQLESAGWVTWDRGTSVDGAGSGSVWRFEDADGDTWRAAVMVTEIYSDHRTFLVYVRAWRDPVDLFDHPAPAELPEAPQDC